MGDLNGDGLADYAALNSDGLFICLRQGVPLDQGFWTCTSPPLTGTSTGLDINNSDLVIADIDGSGIQQVIYMGLDGLDEINVGPVAVAVAPGTTTVVGTPPTKPRPGLLQTVTTLGGATTQITYNTLRGLPNLNVVPTPQWVVQTVSTSNGLSGPMGRTVSESFRFIEPIYDPRDRQFLGFQSALVDQTGDSGAPPVTHATQFATAACVNPAIGASCTTVDYGRYRMLRGVPFNTFDRDQAAGFDFHGTVTQYAEHDLNPGLDGTAVRRLALSQEDTYFSDSTSTLQTQSVTVYTTPSGTAGPNATLNADVPADGTTHVKRTRQEDDFGNELNSVDFGYAGVDPVIRSENDWTLPPGDPTQWSFRVKASRIGYASDGTGASLGSSVRSFGYQYDSAGHPKIITGALSGSLPLTGGTSGSRAAGAAPIASSDNASLVLASVSYDNYGNVQTASGPTSLARCTTYVYDALYQQLPIASSAFPSGCNAGQPLTTVQSWDRGLEVVTGTRGPFTGAFSVNTPTPPAPMTFARFDAFGRLVEQDQPSPGVLGATSPNAALTGPSIGGAPAGVQYNDSGPIRSVRYRTVDGTEAAPIYSDHVRFIDGFGDVIAKLDQTGPLTGTQQWTVSGMHTRHPNGLLSQALLPFNIGLVGDPTTLNVTGLPFVTSNAASFAYDALGRIVSQTDFAQNTTTLTYAEGTSNAMTVKSQDPEQRNPNSKHFGAYTLMSLDGHGRVVASDAHIAGAAGPVDITTARTYLATGELRSYTQSNPGGQTPSYTRWVQYDSLGRLVFNAEPNTSQHFTPTPPTTGTGGVIGWTYAYNDAGEVVGTSDARGCGENLYRDGIGRVVAEDYSPCESSQPPFTAANPATGQSAEAFYVYDTFGRLSRQYDRAQFTTYAYDGRSRVTEIKRQLAAPPASSIGGPPGGRSGSSSSTSGLSISGVLTDANGNPLPNVTVTLSGIGPVQTTVTNLNGVYSFGGLASGSSHSVLPTLGGCTFTPTTVVNLNNLTSSAEESFVGTGPNCGGTPESTPITQAGTIVLSGVVSVAGAGVPGLTIQLNGSTQAVTHTDANGFYSFSGLGSGNYSISPTALPSGCSLTPQVVNNLNSTSTVNFSGSSGCPQGGSLIGAALDGLYAPHVFTRSYQYDEANRVTEATTGGDVSELASNGPASSTVTTTYLRQGIPASVTSSYGSLLANQVVDPADVVTNQQFGDVSNLSASATFDANETLKTYSLSRRAGGLSGGAWTATTPNVSQNPNPTQNTVQTVLASGTVQIDGVANPTLATQSMLPSEWPPGAEPTTSRSFTYGDDYRLIDLSTQYGGPIAPNDVQKPLYTPAEIAASVYPSHSGSPADRVTDQTYAYDGRGNVLSSSDLPANDPFDRSLGTVQTGVPPSVGPDQFTRATSVAGAELSALYDAAGNLTSLTDGASGNEYTYDWDELGRLSTATRNDPSTPAISETFAYDARGRRVRETQETFGSSGGFSHTLQVFDSLVLKKAGFPAAPGDYERDANTEQLYLTSGGMALGRAFFDENSLPSASNGNGRVHVFMPFSDPIGGSQSIVDHDTGELVERVDYQAYGAAASDYRPDRWANDREDLRYTGHWDDTQVGLVYFGARYYSSLLGRWSSPDPLVVHGMQGDPNPYEFAGGSPTRNVDPVGLDFLGDLFGDIAGLFGGGGGESVGVAPGITANLGGFGSGISFDPYASVEGAIFQNGGDTGLPTNGDQGAATTPGTSGDDTSGAAAGIASGQAAYDAANEANARGGGGGETGGGGGGQNSPPPGNYFGQNFGGAGSNLPPPGPAPTPGGQPLPLYLGNQAHQAIGQFYRAMNAAHFNDIFLNQTIRTITGGVNPSSARPDIFDGFTHGVYEIKSVRSSGLALSQASRYVSLLLAGAVPASLGLSSQPGTAGIVSAPGGQFVFFSPADGVIVYDYLVDGALSAIVPQDAPDPSAEWAALWQMIGGSAFSGILWILSGLASGASQIPAATGH